MRVLLGFIAFLYSSSVACEHYTVLVYHGANPPYNYISGNGQAGIFSHLFNRLSELTGHTFELVPWSVARGQRLFDMGKIDIEPGVNPNWRTQSSNPGIYSLPYAYSREVVLGREGERVTDDPKTFYGSVFGRVRGYRYGEFESHFGHTKIMVYDNVSEKELLAQLAYQRVDFIMLGDATAAYYQHRHPDYADFKVVYEISRLPVHMRLQPHLKSLQAELNSALKTMIANQEVEAIYHRYGANSK
ncbi:substrate-binding periplasmic protein [Pseudoalteromonas luteoviolacea]|uniref:Solute-binding protein family 3/N-terminal domain-containing protein n=1 Tax=Pseudoalteromonas luteoviolacea S4054 TaxID=1129367 RepID=A0A0F6A6N9_9GAMM|nr:transporter substrate-binding domain-containing protein [Pseudoalteromonas luteoviolacea]AOT10893.1 amino acid ABC transporter substrate-binding protein [Pseudoalteromonas luteoviolacea]AOT15944.1 amino acid ABC transporter substrate-binding protein [Pseudoalteromonas luteoviolacea]AOT20714.1 amino acid ABC transporter substrate-binding protein [Pseudoalteromonas luteoviolacea]KKE81815.1 hypothetical protein N479_02315 [Pseudoalteromonas luteoviolacea S4054]KZN66227.1 hypothetical protein N